MVELTAEERNFLKQSINKAKREEIPRTRTGKLVTGSGAERKKRQRKSVDNYQSQYRGVSWSANNKKWRVRISINNVKLVIGFFSDEEYAGAIYDIYLLELLKFRKSRRKGDIQFNFPEYIKDADRLSTPATSELDPTSLTTRLDTEGQVCYTASLATSPFQ